MNTSVAVAFLTKMKLIFETDAAGNPQKDKFLAFQNGAFPVAKDNFYFMQPAKYGLDAGSTAGWAMNFSKMFNFVSALDDVITSTSDELDAVYHDILTSCAPATSKRTQQQQQRYEQALQFLQQTVASATGQQVDMLTNYEYYNGIYKQALSAYKNAKIAADTAQGEGAAEIKQQWAAEEPSLKSACDLAMVNWETKGRKTEVENKLADFMLLAGDSPTKTVADLKLDYEEFARATAVDTLANEITYLPTHFSPINFFDDAVIWQKLSLDKAEVLGLLQRAPERLRKLFDLDAAVDIENMTLDYTVVDIVREWFHFQDFLLQRYWKLPAGRLPVSDGQGQGKLPSFPDKMIFVRNIKIVSKQTPQPTPPTNKLDFYKLLFSKVKASIAPVLQNKVQVFQTRESQNKALIKTMTDLAARKGRPLTVVQPAAVKTRFNFRTAPLVLQPAAQLTVAQPMVALRSDKLLMGSVVKAAAAPAATVATTRMATISPGILASRIPTGVVGPRVLQPTVTAPPPPPVQLQVTEQKEMELLGFICRVVPACPNPDPELQWT
ncbi:hypothetical protein [Hymenobacter cavernae]|uniref:Ig-like domain-containing protein n=1 Tax=Hymenobacter cavernae TaxID=2044852 RepID=A0ABQ1UV49_9BACT|nr:hypothetical protein [Hymenobacter cavernae]GGF27635.1 hypothetical protein GCM10011383_44160 [Hymenobacter cavernae]